MAQTKSKSKSTTHSAKNIKQNLHREIGGFVLIFAGLFLIYCRFAEDAGVLGTWIADISDKLVGTVGCVVLFSALILHGIFLLAKFQPFIRYRGSAWLYILVLNITTVLSFGQRDVIKDVSLFSTDFFTILWAEPTRGGIVGHMLSKIYITLLSLTGAWLLVILITIVSFILIFRRGLVEFIRTQTGKMGKGTNGAASSKNKGRTKDNRAVEVTQEDNHLYIRSSEGKKGKQENVSYLEEFLRSDATSKKTKSTPAKINPMEDFVQGEDSVKKQPAMDAKSGADLYIKDSQATEHNTSPQDEMVAETAEKNLHKEKKAYVFPPFTLLDNVRGKNTAAEKQEILKNAAHLEKTLSDFGIEAKVSEISMGPTVTRYELQLQPGIRVSKVVNLADDIAMSLAAQRVRIEAPIPGKSAIGIEVPNKEIAVVKLSHIIQSHEFRSNTSPLAVALGKNLSGEVIVMDITKLPHLLIAGATGSGKSVCINTIIMSVLYHSSPDDVKMILIDPKMVELNVYNEIPHLLIPVVTDPKLASGALNWAVREMTGRYETFAENKVRDIDAYNEKMKQENGEKLPHIILIIDELSDLMMVSAQQVENAICRLAQLARAAGIHLVLATQRPSVNVITGLIKANIPSRISFAVTSQVDSRTILDMGGAEKLLGRGDMLYFPSGLSKPIRAQCAYVSDKEVEKVVSFVKTKRTADYDDEVYERIKSGNDSLPGSSGDGEYDDELLPKAMDIAFERGQISTSNIQRKLRIGYARAGRIVDEMEEKGFISGPNGSKPREVLISYEEFHAKHSEE